MLDRLRRVTLAVLIAGATLASGASADSVSLLNAVANAKAALRTLQTTEETYATIHNATYTNSVNALVHIEPSLAPYRSRFSISTTPSRYILRMRATTGAIFPHHREQQRVPAHLLPASGGRLLGRTLVAAAPHEPGRELRTARWSPTTWEGLS